MRVQHHHAVTAALYRVTGPTPGWQMDIPQRHAPRIIRVWVLGVVLPFQALAQSPSITDQDVDQLIEHLVTIIRDRQESLAQIHISGPIRILSTAETIHVNRSYRGTMLSQTDDRITFKTIDGTKFEVHPERVTRLDIPGHVRGEKTSLHSHGGRTALATLALLSAGLGRHDHTVSAALEYLERHPMPGTYGRALRASAYSILAQQLTNERDRKQVFKLLRRDARWLILAMNDSDGYTYTTHVDMNLRGKKFTRFDNSNSQFGTLGVWAGALAGYDVPTAHWVRVDRFWTREQNEDGGWGYRNHQRSTQNMTIAGINSMIIVLDQLYAKASGDYRLFEGMRTRARAEPEIARVRESIAGGMRWLGRHGKAYDEAYTQLGHERLGLASGQKYFGHHDWYRAGAGGAMQISGWEHMSIENISMWLLFLAYGRAPVLVNKLQWGDQDSGWDYYFRDMYHACRFLSNTYERIYKWQIIDTQSTLYDLQDAPLLYISGQSRFWLPDGFAPKVREYVNRGGTVVGHANLADKAFATSFKKMFETLFSDWGTEFRKLPFDHPIYHTAFGRQRSKLKKKVPLWALSDGYREAVILFPLDIAGALHQSLDKKYPDLFKTFTNLRFYAAGSYKDLPGRLRQDPLAGQQATHRGNLRILRPLTAADRGGAPAVWETMNDLMTRYYGISVQLRRDVLLSNINETSGFDLVHIPGQQAYTFTPQEIRAIKKYAQNGGLVLIEALGGDQDFGKSAATQLSTVFGEEFAVVGPDHALVQGRFRAGKPVGQLKYTPAVRKEGRRLRIPPLRVSPAAGEPGVIFSPLDLSVSAGGHYGHALRGYDSISAQKILRNVLLFRFSQIESRN